MELGNLSGLLSPLIQSAVSFHGVFIPLAFQLLGLAFTLSALFAVYEWWTGGVSNALSRLVRAGLLLTIPMTLLSGGNWQNTMAATGAFFSKTLTQPLLAAGGAANGPDAISQTINKLSMSMFPAAKNPTDKTTYEKIKEFVMSNETFPGMIVSALSQAFIELVLFVLAMLMSVALILALFGPLLALNIGIIFGPLLLAWMPFGPLAHMTRSWLNFMISNGLALVVGIAIAMIAAQTIEAFTSTIAAMSHDPDLHLHQEIAAKIGAFAASASVIVFVSWMLFRADDMASAMVGGGGAGQGGVGALVMTRMMGSKFMPKKDGGNNAPQKSVGGPPGQPPGGGGGGGGSKPPVDVKPK